MATFPNGRKESLLLLRILQWFFSVRVYNLVFVFSVVNVKINALTFDWLTNIAIQASVSRSTLAFVQIDAQINTHGVIDARIASTVINIWKRETYSCPEKTDIQSALSQLRSLFSRRCTDIFKLAAGSDVISHLCLFLQANTSLEGNRPFYSCVHSDLVLDCKRGWGWPCFDTNLTAFHM